MVGLRLPSYNGDTGICSTSPADRSALAAEIKLGAERVGARTDGGLQIFLHSGGNLVAWHRSYYEIALEVSLSVLIPTNLLILGETILQDQTKQEWNGKYNRDRRC